MAMYLGDKPVKAIARSKNNLFNAQEGKTSGSKYIYGVNSITNNNQSIGAGDTVKYTRVYKAGTYTIQSNVHTNSKEHPKDCRFLISAPVKGARYNQYYKMYFTVFTSGYSYTFTAEEDFTIGFAFSGDVGAKRIYTNIMLNEGSTALPYEPYNQLFTAPIKKCVGKNLFDISQANVTVRDDGYFISNVYSTKSFYNIRVSPRKTYYISATAKGLSQSAVGTRLALSVMPKKDGEYVVKDALLIKLVEATEPYTMRGKFTVPDNVTWVSLQAERSIVFKDFMLNEGDTALPYEPYTEWYEY